MKIILADNQELTALALRTVLTNNNTDDNLITPYNIITAEEKIELIDNLNKEPKSLVIIDYHLFDFRDEDEFLSLVDRYPDANWALVCSSMSENVIMKVVKSTHNVSIINKESQIYEVRDILENAIHSRRSICQKAMNTILRLQQKIEIQNQSELTQKELVVLHEMFLGHTAKQIADNLQLSIHTVNTHRKNIFRKFKVNSYYDAISHAIDIGILNPNDR